MSEGRTASDGSPRWFAPRSRFGLTGGCIEDAPGANDSPTPHWPALLPQLIAYTPACDRTPAGTLKRLKQWLRVASACGTFAHFDRVKRATSVDELLLVVDEDKARMNA